MRDDLSKNRTKEIYPFRKLAYASFLKGGILLVLGLVFLFLVKSDYKQGNYTQFAIKISSGLAFLIAGVKLLIRGYKNEYDFSLKDIFDKTRDIKINNLLGQRSNVSEEYDKIFRSISFSSSPKEINKIGDLKFLIFKLFSKKGMSDIFDYAPYPISNFIENQLRPIIIIGYFILILIVYGFFNYLEVIPFGMVWINLFILVGLLTLWYPSKIDFIENKNNNYRMGKRILYFIVFYTITVFLYKPYGSDINYWLLATMLALVSIIIYTSIVSFKLIYTTFSNRKEVNVTKSSIGLNNRKIGRQPEFLLSQFEDVISEKTGWYFNGSTNKSGGYVSGDQKHKGTFEYNKLYETNPKIVSTTYNDLIEKKLSTVYTLGVILFSLGLFVIFFGVLTFPDIHFERVSLNADLLVEFAPKIMWSLFFILLGTSLYFFGNRFVYDMFLFFNTEIFFESNLILFNIKGSYDQYEHISGQTKETNTSTDFTPDIQVCQVTSSIFVHPYMESKNIKNLPRFIFKIQDNDILLEFILKDYDKKLAPYTMSVDNLNNKTKIISEDNNDLLSDE
ncbi:hypothetical protein [Flavivirga spongiicola]|uniref:Uncharacterized protein n=1 Tax=Flavivirga spongiicola TaxID=421621 RepID=A0ABU7XZU3_9FLAO|nr:hypothetical protein [Flavivirga sp. MEBiC05379]MDO5980970.1 hypothetical protein [Flavivirga sp. MEBiC05379]